MNRKRVLTFAVGALLAAAIAGGVAYATIPGPGGTSTASALRARDDQERQRCRGRRTDAACRPNKAPISWNQLGQPGAPGPQGEHPKGEPGAPGTNGMNGTNGKDGVSITTAVEPAGANCANGGVASRRQA